MSLQDTSAASDRQPISADSVIGVAASTTPDFIDTMLGRYLGPIGSEAGFIQFVKDEGNNEDMEFMGRHVTRFGRSVRRHDYGTIMGFMDGPNVWQYRAEFPKAGDGKYMAIAGQNRLYHPHYLTQMVEDGLLRKDVVVLVEGAFKAFAVVGAGFDCISAYGCWSFMIKQPDGTKVLHPGLLALIEKRQVIIALDSDDNDNIKGQVAVQTSTSQLVKALKAADVDVRVASWSPSIGKGPDDIVQIERDRMLAAGVDYEEALKAGWVKLAGVLDSAPEFNYRKANLARARKAFGTRIKREPDLVIHADFTTIVDQLRMHGILALIGYMGSGKTTAISLLLSEMHKMIGDFTWLSINCLKSLARSQAEVFGGEFFNESEATYRALTVCVPSLLKVAGDRSVIIIDEVTQVIDFMFTSGLAQDKRTEIIGRMAQLIKEADLVILMDQDLTEDVLCWVEGIRKEKAFLAVSTLMPFAQPIGMIDKQEDLIAAILDDINERPEGQVTLIHTDSRAMAEVIAAMVSARGCKAEIISSHTNADPTIQEFLGTKGANLPYMISEGVNYLVLTPTVTVGVSIENHRELYHQVFGMFLGKTINPLAMNQAMFRLRRSDIARTVFVAERGTCGSRLAAGNTAAEWLKNFTNNRKAIIHAAKTGMGGEVMEWAGNSYSFTPEAKMAMHGFATEDSSFNAYNFSHNSPNMQLLAHIESSKNAMSSATRASLVALFEAAGNTVIDYLPTPESKAIAKEFYTQARDERSQKEVEAVVAAEEITKQEYDRMQDRDNLTPDENRMVQRYQIASTWETEVVSEVVEFDTPQLRAALRRAVNLVSPGKALANTIVSINKAQGAAQDWSDAHLVQKFVEAIGCGEIIKQVLAGEIENSEACPELTAVAAKIRAHASAWKTVMGSAIKENTTDGFLVHSLFAQYGITCKRQNQRKGTVNPNISPRTYEIDPIFANALQEKSGFTGTMDFEFDYDEIDDEQD